jgi:hypothetical protein
MGKIFRKAKHDDEADSFHGGKKRRQCHYASVEFARQLWEENRRCHGRMPIYQEEAGKIRRSPQLV